MMKLRVFPEPVFAAPKMSLPASAWGMAARWMAVSVVYFEAESPSLEYSDIGSSSNVFASAYEKGEAGVRDAFAWEDVGPPDAMRDSSSLISFSSCAERLFSCLMNWRRGVGFFASLDTSFPELISNNNELRLSKSMLSTPRAIYRPEASFC